MVSFELAISHLLLVTCAATLNAYYVSPNKLKWSDANDYCTVHCNSKLASIHSVQQTEAALQIASNTIAINTSYGTNNIWIGLFVNTTNTTVYKWSDSTLFNYSHNSIETNATDIPMCFAIDISSYEWVQNDCNQHNRFMCNSCSGTLDKYLMVNTKFNYTNADTFCRNDVFNSSLASVHSVEDHKDTQYLVGFDQSWHTFIGLNDLEFEGKFTWTDGTTLDYGKLPSYFGIKPWRMEEPKMTDNERCVALYQEQRWWNDISCNNDGSDHSHTFICNMPSEICFEENWVIYNHSWDMHMCNVQSTATADYALMVLAKKQFVNGDGTLKIEYMHSMKEFMEDAESGIRIHGYNGNICDFYFFSITSDLTVSIIKNKHGKTYLLKTIDLKDLNVRYVFGEYYRFTITVDHMTYFTVELNDNVIINRFYDNSEIINKFESGFIGLYARNISITGKSLFISGSPIVEDFNNTFVDLTLCPTGNPTNYPTFSPTFTPTFYTKFITITFTYHILNASNISTLHNKIVNITKQIIFYAIISLNISDECLFEMNIHSIKDQNNTFALNGSLYLCSEYVYNLLLQMNETLQNNFVTSVNNETNLKLEIENVIFVLESNEIPSKLMTTHSSAEFANETQYYLKVNYKFPIREDSQYSIFWMFIFMFIGMLIMALICCVVYLVLYIKKNEIILSDKRRQMRQSVLNSIQINQGSITSLETFPPKIIHNFSSSENVEQCESEMKKENESLSVVNETEISVNSENIYRQRTVGNSVYINRVLLNIEKPQNLNVETETQIISMEEESENDNESLFGEMKTLEETEGMQPTIVSKV